MPRTELCVHSKSDLQHGCPRLCYRHLFTALVVVLVFSITPVAAQDRDTEPKGIESGNFHVKQTIEFGVRWSGFSGNPYVFGTYIDTYTGPRLLEHRLDMRSLNHQGWLFDNFYIHSFGYGGDPNNVTRLGFDKNRWYSFTGSFRRNKNFWDYNLLANPLNPNVVVANAPPGFSPIVETSPHSTYLVRRMSDFQLTLLPQSRVSFRAGYSRNVSEGQSFSTFHEGTDVLTDQPWRTLLDSYSFGVDVKPWSKTNFSFTQFLHFYRGDTSWNLAATPFQLINGTPVDLGLPINIAASQPCAAPFNPAPNAGTVTGGSCNAYFAYDRVSPVRNSYPTQQFSMQMSEIPNLDLNARISYSKTNGNIFDYAETFSGLVTRSRQRNFSIIGGSEMDRVAVSADFGVTYRITPRLHLINSFHWLNFRIPGRMEFSEASLFGTRLDTAPITYSLATCPPPFTAATCPQHATSSPADLIIESVARNLKQDAKTNTTQLLWNFARRSGLSAGFRYGRRTINQSFAEMQDLTFFPILATRGGCPAANVDPATGICTLQVQSEEEREPVHINEYAALFSIWYRPYSVWRIAFDTELGYNDAAFTRISPRQFQRYRIRSTYSPVDWANIGLVFNIAEARNNVFQIQHKRHSRSYGANVDVAASERVIFNAEYEFADIFSTTDICYSLSGTPSGAIPCPIGGPAPIFGLSVYEDKAHFGSFGLLVRPSKWFDVAAGYTFTRTNGFATYPGSDLPTPTPAPPAGTLKYTYHLPYATLTFFPRVGWAIKGHYGYNDYNERADIDPTGPRSFRGNQFTGSIRYSF